MEELLSLKWNNHRSTFLHILGVLRDKQAYTDVTLACDGKFYNVHKLVLSTCSDYFSAMFDKTDKTCKSPIIVLKDIKCEDLESLLDYMYLGEVNVRQCDLASLIKSAECLRIKGLAVPDDEPPKKVPNRTESIRRDNVSGSPPPKRKRRDEGEDGRDDVRPIVHSTPISSSRPKSPISQRLSPTPHRTPQQPSPVVEERKVRPFSSPTESRTHSQPESRTHSQPESRTHSQPQPVATGSSAGSGSSTEQQPRTDNNPSVVKVEREDHDDGTIELPGDTYDIGNDSYKEEDHDDHDDSGGGGGDLSSDLPEFLQAAASGSLGNYGHQSFPGPSNFQPGDISGWQGEGSSMGFPAHMNYTSDGSSQQNAPGGRGAFGSLLANMRSRRGRGGGGAGAGLGACCLLCGKTFRWQWLLQRHLRSHTGERPYSCPHCPYAATQKFVLNRHILTQHKEVSAQKDQRKLPTQQDQYWNTIQQDSGLEIPAMNTMTQQSGDNQQTIESTRTENDDI